MVFGVLRGSHCYSCHMRSHVTEKEKLQRIAPHDHLEDTGLWGFSGAKKALRPRRSLAKIFYDFGARMIRTLSSHFPHTFLTLFTSVLKFLIFKVGAKVTKETSGTSQKLRIKSLPCRLSGRDVT